MTEGHSSVSAGVLVDLGPVLPPSAPEVFSVVSQPTASPELLLEALSEARPAGSTCSAEGFGHVLAAARQAQGIPVDEMARRLRLQPRQLDAIEHERLDELPSAMFIRGYVRSYARELKIDPGPLLEVLGQRLSAPFNLGLAVSSGPAMTEVRRADVERAFRLLVIGGFVVALTVLAVVGWLVSTRPKPAQASAVAPNSSSVALSAPAALAPAPAVVDPASAANLQAAVSAQSSATTTGSVTASVPSAESKAAAASPASVQPTELTSAPLSAAPVATAPAANGLRVQVGARSSWIEVTDAEGRVVFVGTLSSGAEQMLANVRAPLRLVVGNASTVSVTYQGQRVDLRPHIRANDLARLTLE